MFVEISMFCNFSFFLQKQLHTFERSYNCTYLLREAVRWWCSSKHIYWILKRKYQLCFISLCIFTNVMPIRSVPSRSPSRHFRSEYETILSGSCPFWESSRTLRHHKTRQSHNNPVTLEIKNLNLYQTRIFYCLTKYNYWTIWIVILIDILIWLRVGLCCKGTSRSIKTSGTGFWWSIITLIFL